MEPATRAGDASVGQGAWHRLWFEPARLSLIDTTRMSAHTPYLPEPPTRRFAPVLHFLTPVDEVCAEQLRVLASDSHSRGRTLEQLCYDLTARALALGYSATIAMQEVASRAMPSFPGEQVVTPVLLIDLRSLRPRPAACPTSSR